MLGMWLKSSIQYNLKKRLSDELLIQMVSLHILGIFELGLNTTAAFSSPMTK